MLGKQLRPTAMFIFLLLMLWNMIIPPSCLAHSKHDTIRFGIFPYISPKSVIELFGPLAARLENKLGVKVLIVSAPDAAAFLDKGLAGEYDLALPSPTIYYKMRPAGYTPIAMGMPSFRGGAIVRHDSTIKSIEQCRGKKVAAIGRHSYAGYIFFKDLLDKKKIDTAKDLNIQFLSKVDSVIYGVLNKKYDVGLLRTDTLEMPYFISLKDQFRVIAHSAEIPQFPFTVTKGMDQRTVATIRDVLISLSPSNPDDLKILKSLQIHKIIGATKGDYDQFYKVIKGSEYFRQR